MLIQSHNDGLALATALPNKQCPDPGFVAWRLTECDCHSGDAWHLQDCAKVAAHRAIDGMSALALADPSKSLTWGRRYALDSMGEREDEIVASHPLER